MKKILFFAAFFLMAANAEAKVTIFACEPEWASLAREIVGDKAAVVSATTAKQNPRTTQIKPNLIKLALEIDMVFCSGGGLEDSWLKNLTQRNANPQIKPGEVGYLMAIDYSKKIEITDVVKKTLDEKEKEKQVAPRYATRVHLNPHNINNVALEFTRRIKLIDPLNANYYENSSQDFLERWNKAITEWEKKAEPLKGKKIVAHAGSFEYLVDWLGMEYVQKIDLESNDNSKSWYLDNMARELKKDKAEMLIFAPFENRKAIFFLSKKTDTRVVLLPFSIKGTIAINNLFNLFENTINRLQLDCSKMTCKSISASLEQKSKKTEQQKTVE